MKQIKFRDMFTPNNITELKENEIFIFGSNLYNRCVNRPVVFDALCSGLVGICKEVIMFRFSKELTDKINANVSFDEILEANKDVLKRLKEKGD